MTILYGLLGLGVIVFIHELGHFIAARLSGVKVESFSVGMGPILLHKTIGDTDYRLSLIPLGGYCGMKGEKMFQEAIENNLDSIPKEKDSFYGVSPLRRIFIAFSGPFANVLFTVVAMTIISMIGYTFYATSNKVLLASEAYEGSTSVAQEAGIQRGDIITSINGKETKYFSDISEIVSTSAQQKIDLTVLRNNEQLKITMVPELDSSTGAGRIGIVNWVDLDIDAVVENSAAFDAGLMTGDKILKLNEYDVENTVDFSNILQKKLSDDDEVLVQYLRDGMINETTYRIPKNVDNQVDLTNIGVQWKVEQVHTQTYSFFPAIGQGVIETVDLIVLTLKGITLLFRGVDLTQAVSGPIGITMMLGETTQSSFQIGFFVGVVTVLNFLSLISISLFIMNLLPIPILDGGIILFSFIEVLRGRPVKPAVLYKVQFIGLGLILFLFVIGFIGDINRLFGGGF